MGCHTWVYKKVSTLTDEYKQKAVDKAIDEISKTWFLTKDKDYVVMQMDKTYQRVYRDDGDVKHYTEEDYDKDVKKYQSRLKRLKVEGFDYLVKLKRQDASYVKKHGGEYYWKILIDVPFRVYGYPTQTFTDYGKLLKWLQKWSKEHEVGFYDNEKSEWVSGYSAQLEERIRDFYGMWGEDTLYFEFG